MQKVSTSYGIFNDGEKSCFHYYHVSKSYGKRQQLLSTDYYKLI